MTTKTDNKKALGLLLTAIILISITACSGLKMGVGLKGTMLKDNFMTLDGDTFVVYHKISDSLLIVYNYANPDDKTPVYLLRYECNGFYYPQLGAKSITTIDNTDSLICIDEKDIYDIGKKKVVFTSPCSTLDMFYLGKWNNLAILANLDTICFSDGKCVGLQEGVTYKDLGDGSFADIGKSGVITLAVDAQTRAVTFAELYNTDKLEKAEKDTAVERISRDYHMKPRGRHEDMEAGFRVDLDVPTGCSESDQAIREWMVTAIRDDAFSLLENNRDIPVGKSGSPKELTASLDGYGVLWEKICRAENQVGDTLRVRLFGDIRVRKIADCSDYATYHYWALLYNGGLHELPRGYYITYDKRRGRLLDAKNSVKPQMMQKFRLMALKNLQKEYDIRYERNSTWDDFTGSVFSFHCPSIDTSGMNNIIRSQITHNYSCDEWGGWNGYNDVPFTEEDFPLTHFAVLPEGIVLTYHPYQIDCFAAGEYNVVIPFKEANKCLVFDYSKHENLKPKLQTFIKQQSRPYK